MTDEDDAWADKYINVSKFKPNAKSRLARDLARDLEREPWKNGKPYDPDYDDSYLDRMEDDLQDDIQAMMEERARKQGVELDSPLVGGSRKVNFSEEMTPTFFAPPYVTDPGPRAIAWASGFMLPEITVETPSNGLYTITATVEVRLDWLALIVGGGADIRIVMDNDLLVALMPITKDEWQVVNLSGVIFDPPGTTHSFAVRVNGPLIAAGPLMLKAERTWS